MPASTLDPVNAALRSSLGERSATKEVALDTHISLSTNKALLSTIKFEPSGTYQSTVSDKLKFKYGNQKNNQQSGKLDKNINMGAGETLTLAKYVLYPIESVQLGWNNTDWSVGAGMVNMGNTCYLNSTLQALFHVPALVNWLISDKQHTAECDDTESGCIICAMRKTLQDSQQRSTNTIRPFLIYNKLRIVCRNLIPGRQEDAHEFLRYLVEAMEKAYLSRFKNHSEFDSRTKETTPLNQILGGYLRSAVRCLECSHVSTTFQHFQDLLLDIRKAQTLEEALDTYFSREKLDDESYQCEACHKKVPATKQFFLERAPMVLCIQLKRFSISNNKITKHIQFRQKLELTKYSRHKPATSLVYKLVALVTHMGPTVNCGHYTAVAQAPCGNFYQFDDSMVRPISHQAVFNTNAYIMLYELESSPFSPKAQASHKAAKSQPVNGNCSKSILSEISPKTNGITSSKVYGPQLPPPVKQENDENNSVTNGNESSTKTETDQQQNKTASSPVNKVKMYATYSNQTFNYNSVLNSNVKKEKNMPELEPDQDSTTKQLVPYEMDDSSSCSEEPPLDSRIVTKVSSSKNWKTNCSTSNRDSSAGSDKVKFQNDIKTSVNELLKMSHGGYSAPVSTWNGTRAQLDKEISNERREERKRALADSEDDEDRVKHQKVNANGTYKSNPGYNPIQEFHNAKNWNKSNSSYHNSNNNNNNNNNRQFFNNNRHRRNGFHHKAYHKNNYRFRQ